MKRCALAFAAMLAACSPAGKDASAPAGDWALRLTVTPAPGAGPQRLSLPASAIIASKRADLGDVRLVDAKGRFVPMARQDHAADPVALTAHALKVSPVLGGAGSQGSGRISVSLDEKGSARAITLDPAGQPATGATRVVAALAFPLKLAEPARAIDLEAALPAQVPVDLKVEASTDLARWDVVAERTLFDPGDAVQPSLRIALAGSDLTGRYLRLSWGDAPGVEVRGATLLTGTVPIPPPLTVKTTGASLANPRELVFTLPTAAPLAGIRVRPAGTDGVLPLQLFGRANREAQWQLVGADVVRPGGNEIIAAGGTILREFRLLADQRTSGFSAPPELELQFEPAALVVAFNGTPPYTLLAGKGDAAPALLERTSVAPDDGPAVSALPEARIDGAGEVSLNVAPAGQEGPLSGKSAALWAVLLAGTALLGWAVVRLMRANAATGREPGP